MAGSMHTYRIKYKLKGDSMPRVKYVPSYSEGEAIAEFTFAVKLVYDQRPTIVDVDEMPRNGEVVSRETP